jgi:hypothetical protein
VEVHLCGFGHGYAVTSHTTPDSQGKKRLIAPFVVDSFFVLTGVFQLGLFIPQISTPTDLFAPKDVVTFLSGGRRRHEVAVEVEVPLMS